MKPAHPQDRRFPGSGPSRTTGSQVPGPQPLPGHVARRDVAAVTLAGSVPGAYLPSMVRLVRAGAADAEGLAGVLASAYRDDPVWSWLIPRDRKWRLRLLFRGHLGQQIPHGRVWTDDGRRVACVWAEPVPGSCRRSTCCGTRGRWCARAEGSCRGSGHGCSLWNGGIRGCHRTGTSSSWGACRGPRHGTGNGGARRAPGAGGHRRASGVPGVGQRKEPGVLRASGVRARA